MSAGIFPAVRFRDFDHAARIALRAAYLSTATTPRDELLVYGSRRELYLDAVRAQAAAYMLAAPVPPHLPFLPSPVSRKGPYS